MTLIEFRQQNELSQPALASMLGWPPSSGAIRLSRIENGTVKLDADDVEHIGNVTDGKVTLDDLHKVRLGFLNRDAEPAQ